MRFWITRNGEIPIREQLVRQAVLGILSQDLPPGARLPSVRAMARRHRIHSNTVSAAWHDLLDQGWLELRRGSGSMSVLSNPPPLIHRRWVNYFGRHWPPQATWAISPRTCSGNLQRWCIAD